MGIFEKHPEWKWLNIQSFCEALRSREEVVAIKYFTALIDPKKSVSPRRERQSLYLEALGTLPQTTLYFGHYLSKAVKCHTCGATWMKQEEKMTDVNIATEMLTDQLGMSLAAHDTEPNGQLLNHEEDRHEDELQE